MLSAAVNVPEQALELVDAFIPKDCLASELLPAIAQLHGPDVPIRLPMMHDDKGAIYENLAIYRTAPGCARHRIAGRAHFQIREAGHQNWGHEHRGADQSQ
jgi:hypothetical protein